MAIAKANRFQVGIPAEGLKASRATLPKRLTDYFCRPRLLERYQPLEKRVGVLHAPCGFGKTVLLNEICQRERDRGTLVAWLRLDNGIDGELLSSYLAYAFGRGGLDLSLVRNLWKGDRHPHKTSYRLGLLLRAIENHAKPCFLALDQVDGLDARETIAMIDFLVRRSPRNLHFAMTMRSYPPGLELTTAALDHQCEVLTVDDLRFTDAEIALFLGGRLSREELVAAVKRTEGWPVALRTYRDLNGDGGNSNAPSILSGYQATVEEFLGARLMSGLTPESREFLLDFGLFETIDHRLVEEVFADGSAQRRSELLTRFRGLLRPVDRSGAVLRLHPVIREYCRVRRLREDAVRFRRLHRRLAVAMARRGDLDAAVRHASATGEDEAFGEILEVGCGVGLLFGTGIKPFLNAVGFLDSNAIATAPRLALVRCIGLLVNGDERAASALFERVEKTTGDSRHDRERDGSLALEADRFIARSLLQMFTCTSVGDTGQLEALEEVASLAAEERLAPVHRGSLYTLLCVQDSMRTKFRRSRHWGVKAREFFALGNAAHGEVLIDTWRGAVAMAQGRVQDAQAAFMRGRMIPAARILQAELQIERNRMGLRLPEGMANARLETLSGWLDVHAAMHGIRAELAFENGGTPAALNVLEDSLALAARRGLAGLVRILSAQRSACLAKAGRVDAARRAWSEAGLPAGLVDQLDLDGQSWREMEAIACARIGVLQAGFEFDKARHLAGHLHETAQARGLTRTLMRCLAEWMILEYRAADVDAAAGRLRAFLHRYRDTDYSRPLARCAEVSVQVLQHLIDQEVDSDVREQALSMLQDVGQATAAEETDVPHYSAQEIRILQGLAFGLRNKEIARHVALTESGVCYHLKKIYRKMGVNRRGDALERARTAGLV